MKRYDESKEVYYFVAQTGVSRTAPPVGHSNFYTYKLPITTFDWVHKAAVEASRAAEAKGGSVLEYQPEFLAAIERWDLEWDGNKR